MHSGVAVSDRPRGNLTASRTMRSAALGGVRGVGRSVRRVLLSRAAGRLQAAVGQFFQPEMARAMEVSSDSQSVLSWRV